MLVRVFVGFDSREVVAYHVLCQSILEHSSVPVCFVPVALNTLTNVFKRDPCALQSTQFSFSRFLVPRLSGYAGWSLYLDCDMLFRRDIAELWALRDDAYAVMCCQHDYVPKSDSKFFGHVQSRYARKNWSSLVLFNNAACASLTKEYVSSASGLDLHQFRWLDSRQIGALPLSWNHLVGEYAYDPAAANVHFTLGGPYLGDDHARGDYADEWYRIRERMQSAAGPARSLASPPGADRPLIPLAPSQRD